VEKELIVIRLEIHMPENLQKGKCRGRNKVE
jgi:hypothetical protein